MLGDELNKARLAKGLSQQTLATKAGVTREYISKLENNRSSPTVDTLLAICGVLDIRASQLIAKIK
ncbi:MAG: helix-turn-helix transcriptional regulator [Planctomycetota bacterium]